MKTLYEITCDEWTRWHWVQVTEPGDKEPVFVKGVERTPSESLRAASAWDTWAESDLVKQRIREANADSSPS